MRAVLQRVTKASVTIEGKVEGQINKGLVLLVGINTGDNLQDFNYMLEKSLGLRIFEDENDKMNLSARDLGLGMLIIPNFTIYADARKGKRPSFAMGAAPQEARETFEAFVEYARANSGGCRIESGIFQADMQVELINDGPITILLDSAKEF